MALLSQLFTRPPQFFHHLQHTQMLLSAFFEGQFKIHAK